jgi:hypothetical protein
MHLNLTPTGKHERTGYGDIPTYTTTDEKPRIDHTSMGIVYTDVKVEPDITGWIWIEGPTWQAMLFAPGMYFTTIMGGIKDK